MRIGKTLPAGEMLPEMPPTKAAPNGAGKSTDHKRSDYEPPKLGKAVRLPVPDFSDPNRPPVCLEVDFPIAPINALSNLEGNAGKPIYQMSKWWARRRSSVFRSLLIAAAVEAPEDPSQAAKRVWEHYYCNHQKAGHFKSLRVLDPFMGGGTTLVEGARLGFQMTGVDLNPIAWFVTKNELTCSDPDQVQALFDHIEATVKPLVQPFYTTTCPRGHRGKWVDSRTGEEAEIDPIDIPRDQRQHYRWEGPEVIYTFWGKHGPCISSGCAHRTPVFKSPVVAEKRLSAYYIPIVCPSCGHGFNIELGETRMAPGVQRVVLDNEPSFTETTQRFAMLLNDYGKGTPPEKRRRVAELLQLVNQEPGLFCAKCGRHAGGAVRGTLENHFRSASATAYNKAEFGIRTCHVYMTLLIHPDWLAGSYGLDGTEHLGGWAGASPQSALRWWRERQQNLVLIEVRGRVKLSEDETGSNPHEEEVPDDIVEEDTEQPESEADRRSYGLPREIVLKDGTVPRTRLGTVPKQSHFACGSCGRPQDLLESVKATGHTAPVSPYAIQCHCPQCKADGYNYGGRYFKAPEEYDLNRLALAEQEWSDLSSGGLSEYWPQEALLESYMTHKLNGGIPNWGYTHWWKMFNARQLLVHGSLLRAITEASSESWPLDVLEQALGAFQQYLRMMSMFSFWHRSYDKLAPHLSNANFHPKQQVVETNVYGRLGYGKWTSCCQTVIDALAWCREPWELATTTGIAKARSIKVQPGDPIPLGVDVFCSSSTDLSAVTAPNQLDLVITDPPFGNNLFYADLADYFYVWLRIPLLRWYADLPEQAYFMMPRTPHAMEAIENPIEHPDDRERWETEAFIPQEHLIRIREISGDETLREKDPNPIYRPLPASDFYRQTLCACWTEAGRLLKPGGLMAFTFHHSEDAPWVDVLKALFDAGYILVATYPIRSDESKGAKGAFGSRKIEYDIIHVCRKRLDQPQAVSWAKMRRWVKDEAQRLKELLEHSHGKELPESDLLVILRGKALEYYSRHYGQIYRGEGELLGVRDALLGINQLLEDLLQGDGGNGIQRPPDSAEPASRLFLRIFQGRSSMTRDVLSKTLRGTGYSQADLESWGWARGAGTSVRGVPIAERFEFFTTPGRNRKVLKTDLDQAHFLIGAAMPKSGVDVTAELNRGSMRLKRSVDDVIQWYAQTDPSDDVRTAATLALHLLTQWRTKIAKAPEAMQRTMFDALDIEEM